MTQFVLVRNGAAPSLWRMLQRCSIRRAFTSSQVISLVGGYLSLEVLLRDSSIDPIDSCKVSGAYTYIYPVKLIEGDGVELEALLRALFQTPIQEKLLQLEVWSPRLSVTSLLGFRQ